MRTQSPNLKWTTKRLITQLRKSDHQIGGAFFWLQTQVLQSDHRQKQHPYREVVESLLIRDRERHLTSWRIWKPDHLTRLDAELTNAGSSPEADC